MDTKLATSQIRLNQWAGIIKDCKVSGLKVDDYCRQHNLSRDAYYYWLRKVKASALQQAGFVEIPAVTPKGADNAEIFRVQLTVRVGEVEISLNNDTPSELLARTLEVIHRAQ